MTISVVGSATITSNNIAVNNLSLTPHASTSIGDIVIATYQTENGAVDSVTPPSGWTRLSFHNGYLSGAGIDVFYKIMESGDLTSHTFTNSTTRKSIFSMLTVTGVDASTPIGNYAVHTACDTSTGTDTIHTPKTRVKVDGSLQVCIFAVEDDATITLPGTLTSQIDLNDNASRHKIGTVSVNAGITADQNVTSWAANGYKTWYNIILQPSAPSIATDKVVCVAESHIDNVVLPLASSPYKVNLPPHQTGDLIFGLVSTEIGMDSLGLSGTGWAKQYVTDYLTAYHCDVGIFYKVATSSNEVIPELSSNVLRTDVVLSLFVLRNVDTTTFTRGAASAISYAALSAAALSQPNINPEFDNCFLIQTQICNQNIASITLNGWDGLIRDNTGVTGGIHHASLEVSSFIEKVTAPSILYADRRDIIAVTFIFAPPDAKQYPRARFIDFDTTTSTTCTVSTYNPLFDKYFSYASNAVWVGALTQAGTNNSGEGWTSPVRTWYLQGEQSSLETSVCFWYTAVGTTDYLVNFTYTAYTSWTGKVLLAKLVGVNPNYPISSFQQQLHVGTNDGFTPKPTNVTPGTTHVMFAVDDLLPILSPSSGYIKYIEEVSLETEKYVLAAKTYLDAGATTGAFTHPTSGTEYYISSFLLNPYNTLQKQLKPNIRTIVSDASTSTSARSIYNVNLKAGDMVVFFGATRGTSAQLNFATSLGTATDLLTKWDSANGWNNYIKAIKITSPVTSTWTVTQSASVGTGFNKIVTAVVIENVIDDVNAISAYEAVNNSASTIDVTAVSPNSVAFGYGYGQSSNLSSLHIPDWVEAKRVNLSYTVNYLLAAPTMHPEPANDPTFTITYTSSTKLYGHVVTLPGWSSGSGFFFGTPF